jgi:hypothetical protein
MGREIHVEAIMKYSLMFTLLLTPVFIGASSQTWAAPPPDGRNAFFHSSLQPYGEWIEAQPGSMVWRPYDTPRQWRPYVYGQWRWTDEYGWYWNSREPFGWITYHYGRWYDDDEYGWVWVPDDVWGPAWVDWRYSDDYIGWAPLPPSAVFDARSGIRFTAAWDAPVGEWNFVLYSAFGSPIYYRNLIGDRDVPHILHDGRHGSPYAMDGGRIMNRGIERSMIERRGGFHVSSTPLHESNRPGERFVKSDRHLEVYRATPSDVRSASSRLETRNANRQNGAMGRLASPSDSRSAAHQARQQAREQMTDRRAERRSQRQELINRYHEGHQNPSLPSKEERRREGR